MNPNRRGILAALLCSPAFGQTRERERGTIIIEFAPEMADSVVLEIRCKGKTVKFTASELMAALEPISFPVLRDSYPPMPVQNKP